MTETVTILVPLSDPALERLRQEQSLEIVYRPDLMPEQRYPGDHKGDPGFRRSAAQEAEWRALLAEARIAFGVPGDGPDGLGAVLEAAPRLEWLQATAAGAGQQLHGAPVSDEAKRRIVLTTGAGVHAAPLAEFALFGILSAAKDSARLSADKAAHVWPPLRWEMAPLWGSTLLILGYGSLGRAVAERAAAFGMRVHAAAFSGPREDPHATVHGLDAIDDLLPHADAVVLALPSSDDTVDLLDAKRFTRFKDGATLVNIGRGDVLDEQALVEALRSGRIAHAALDVFRTEPLPADSPLWEEPNLIVSPHTAALSSSEDLRLALLFLDNLDRFRTGRPLRNTVVPGVWV